LWEKIVAAGHGRPPDAQACCAYVDPLPRNERLRVFILFSYGKRLLMLAMDARQTRRLVALTLIRSLETSD